MKKIFLYTSILSSFLHTQANLETTFSNNLAFHSLQDFIELSLTQLEAITQETAIRLENGCTQLMPTHAHLLYACNKKAQEYLKAYFEGNHILSHTNAPLAYEHVCANNNWYTLYHCTLPRYFVKHCIDTYICGLYEELIHGHVFPTDTLLIMRQPIPHQAPDPLEEQKAKRLDYIHNGIISGHDTDPEHQRYLLSCNIALSGNLTRMSSCSLDYWHKKKVITRTLKFSLNSIFDQYPELKPFLSYVKDTLEQASTKFLRNVQSGIMLQLIFKDKTLLQECVYPSLPGGALRPVHMHGTITTDIADILSALYKAPHSIENDIDGMQARIIFTQDKLLHIADPYIYTNFEIRAYCAQQEMLEQFRDEIKTIMQDVKTMYVNRNTLSYRTWLAKQKICHTLNSPTLKRIIARIQHNGIHSLCASALIFLCFKPATHMAYSFYKNGSIDDITNAAYVTNLLKETAIYSSFIGLISSAADIYREFAYI